ncbi:MAG: hypothetical protein JWN46_3887 [Acidimicrobiales bacterium]|nr:hypothetical protein [Acidimicrobiales bacterium]
MSDPTAPVERADEARHAPGTEQYWSESWYLDFTDAEAGFGGYVRLGFYPNLGVAWYWACAVGEGRPLVTVIDHEVPIPAGPGLELRTEGLWSSIVVETPLDHVSVGCEAFAVGVDDPAEVYGDLRGDRVPFGLDLEWETDGGLYPYPGVTRYEVPCRVHGEVLLGDEHIEIDGWGQRDHSWGVRDWWWMGSNWTAGRLDDGTRFHGTHVTYEGTPVYATGYVQPPGGPLRATTYDRGQQLGREGFPDAASCQMDDLALEIEPVAFSPVLLTAADGRRNRLARALCRFRDVDGARRGVGWTEWNEPEAT